MEHTIRRFLSLDGLRSVIVSTSESYQDRVERILEDVLPVEVSGLCVAGGVERQHSIFNALQKVGETDLIMVHDAVRPFVTLSQIERCCRAASDAGAAVLGVPVRDTIKIIDQDLFVKDTPSRKYLWRTQTPQIFKKSILINAYSKAFDDGYIGTDDASLVERLGDKVKMVESDHTNFKITYPLDLKLARLLIRKEDQDYE